MIATSPQGPDTVRATFRLRCGVGYHEVCVVGEFNDWSRTANPMTFDGYAYVAEIIIATGRTYRFRYLVDNERWQIDWAADRFAPNEARGFDARRDLTRRRTLNARPEWRRARDRWRGHGAGPRFDGCHRECLASS